MRKEQFMIDHYKPDDMIEVQCLWLQNELRELEKHRTENKALKYRMDGLLHKIDRLNAQIELSIVEKPFKHILDERV